MELKSTDELINILEENNKEQYSEEAFDAIREILNERGVSSTAKEHNPAFSEKIQAKQDQNEMQAPDVTPILLKANSKIVAENSCDICNATFSLGEDINKCGKCGKFYHKKCWEDYPKKQECPICRQIAT